MSALVLFAWIIAIGIGGLLGLTPAQIGVFMLGTALFGAVVTHA